MGAGQTEQIWKDLFIQSQGGDKRAYEELLKGISRYIKVSLKRSYSNDQIVDELSQEILLAFHRSKHTYDVEKPFRPWLMAIVRFKTIDHLRKTYRLKDREVITDDIETYDTPGANVDFDIGLDLERALDKLPDKQRKAFSLLKLQGLSVKEASEKTGWSESNIKVSAHRAYKLLRKALGQEGI